jgi:hypothetical protein
LLDLSHDASHTPRATSCNAAADPLARAVRDFLEARANRESELAVWLDFEVERVVADATCAAPLREARELTGRPRAVARDLRLVETDAVDREVICREIERPGVRIDLKRAVEPGVDTIVCIALQGVARVVTIGRRRSGVVVILRACVVAACSMVAGHAGIHLGAGPRAAVARAPARASARGASRSPAARSADARLGFDAPRISSAAPSAGGAAAIGVIVAAREQHQRQAKPARGGS